MVLIIIVQEFLPIFSPNNLPSKVECGREQHGDCDEHNGAAAVVPTQDTFGKPSC